MAGSMFDQLKKAGLVDKNKAKQHKRDKYQQAKGNKAKKHVKIISESADLVAKVKQQQLEKDQALNKQRKVELGQKEKQAQCVQIIQSNQIKDIAGEEEFSFADGTAVKTLNVKADIRKKLVAETIRIARFKGGFVLITAEAAERIIQRDENFLISNSKKDDGLSDEDRDYYAQFEIPDDLVW
jgi:uncharacterized protein YaiL (DUF2058 family)